MNVLETLQRVAATTQRLDMALAEIDRERASRQRFEDAIIRQMERFEAHASEIRERVARLETSRAADQSQMAAELARFKTEVERAQLKLSQLVPASPEPRPLPDREREEESQRQ